MALKKGQKKNRTTDVVVSTNNVTTSNNVAEEVVVVAEEVVVVAEEVAEVEMVAPKVVGSVILGKRDSQRFNVEKTPKHFVRTAPSVSVTGGSKKPNTMVVELEFFKEKAFYNKIQVHKHRDMKVEILDGYQLAVIEERETLGKNLVYFVNEVIPLSIGTAVITTDAKTIELTILRENSEDRSYILCDLTHFKSVNQAMGRAFNILKAQPNIENMKSAEKRLKIELDNFLLNNTVVETKMDILPKVYSEFILKTKINQQIVQELKHVLPNGFFSEKNERVKFELASKELYNVTEENRIKIVNAFDAFIKKANK